MIKTRFISAGALALVTTLGLPLRAQGTGPTVELAFGYECGDRFLVRNDGTNPVVIEYAMAGSQDKSQLHLNGKQSAEIASAQSGNMELWVGGKIVASEPKGNRACNAPRNSARATVRPVDPDETAAAQPADSSYNAPPVVVYASPYDYYSPYYDPYPYYGYDPFFYPTIGFYGGFYGGGYYRGGGFRGGGGYRGGGGFRGGGGTRGGRGGHR